MRKHSYPLQHIFLWMLISRQPPSFCVEVIVPFLSFWCEGPESFSFASSPCIRNLWCKQQHGLYLHMINLLSNDQLPHILLYHLMGVKPSNHLNKSHPNSMRLLEKHHTAVSIIFHGIFHDPSENHCPMTPILCDGRQHGFPYSAKVLCAALAIRINGWSAAPGLLWNGVDTCRYPNWIPDQQHQNSKNRY